MSPDNFQKDLVVLAADKSIEMALRGILGRHESLGIRSIRVDYLVHPEHDPGCAHNSDHLLRPYINSARHALVIFDLEGSGLESTSRNEIESELETNLARNGWSDRAAVIVISPELENWVWSDSPEVEHGTRKSKARLFQRADRQLARKDSPCPIS
ncbi:MAG: hypothetical protein JW818_11180 [Pirellulales bacterium]|nr:hypothetical protein [Pirellulales bacterium]